MLRVRSLTHLRPCQLLWAVLRRHSLDVSRSHYSDTAFGL